MTSKGRTIHNRNIDITIYEGTVDTIIVEGVLHDKRLVDSYLPAGTVKPAGSVHHMIVCMEVRKAELRIEAVSVELPTIPHAACNETRESLMAIKGMTIASGFSSRIKKLLGGTKSCSHLVALLLAMAPAVVQGAWSAMTQEPYDAGVYMAMAQERVKNTCRVWREGGPLLKELDTAAKAASPPRRQSDTT